ncbi:MULTISPECIES: DedA family protein [unclassified Halomicrobium]|uniref:DedA family protein n=1 Tax=unclassified Halomicrobium TaxID=2610901 RepID=UPI001298491D|nr:VTT domain-containing protein [Halomicrobium sp. LC1Hm]QGA81125.1 putative membrane-associated protein, DedA family [Halomicrobium sp. LC1Hm]
MASLAFPARSRLRTWAEEYGLLAIALSFVVLAGAGVALFVVGDEQLARELIQRYGLAALLVIFVLEGAMLLYFAPSEVLVPAAIGALATTDAGYDWGVIVAIFVVAVVGATAGQTALFVLAQRGGREWLLQKPWFRVSESKLDRFDGWFDRWGHAAVPVSNALLFTRGMLTVPAGVAEMRVRRFAALSAAGTLVFETWLAVSFYYLNEAGFLWFL